MSSRTEYALAEPANAGANTIIVDRAPEFAIRLGKVAIGVGTATCELREVTNIVGTTLTLNTGLYYAQADGADVVWFEDSFVPASWWGVRGNVSTTDDRLTFSAALRAVGRGQAATSGGLILDGQGKDIYVSGPVTIPQGVWLHDMRVRAMAEASYVGSLDGPEHPTYETNALMMLGQVVHDYTYDQATNVFTTRNASGGATSHNAGMDSRISFDANGSPPGGLVPGRRYRIVETGGSLTTGQFRIAHRPGQTPLSFSSNGSGSVHLNLDDNCKLYATQLRIDGSNLGMTVAAGAAATDVFTTYTSSSLTTQKNHGLADGDMIRWVAPASSANAMPGGVQRGLKNYYVRDATSTTFKLALTPGGTAIDVASDGQGRVVVPTRSLNGAIWGMQQPSRLDNVRVDNCPGFGVRVLTQQSWWSNYEAIACGTGLEVGGEESGAVGEFIWMFGVNIDQSHFRAFNYRIAKDVYVHDWHTEHVDAQNFVLVDMHSLSGEILFENSICSISGSGNSIFRCLDPHVDKTSYTIRKFDSTNVTADAVMIDDRTRGIYKHYWNDFRGRIDEFEAWSTSSSTAYPDPHPQAYYGERGYYEYAGGTQPSVAKRSIRAGAGQTGDFVQYRTWSTGGTASLNVGTDTFTLNGHGLAENEEFMLSNGGTFTVEPGSDPYLNLSPVYARNVTANTFQIARTPGTPPVAFASASIPGSWAIYRSTNAGAPVFRINHQGLPIVKRNTAPAAADLQPGEFAIWFDPTPGAAALKYRGKDSAGTEVNGTL